VAFVDLDAIAANYRAIRDRVAPRDVIAVVKANAYGHGLARVLPALKDADGLALVEPEVASELREQHYTRRILMLEGFFAESELPEFAHRRLATVVHDREQVRMLETAVLSRPLEVFVKVNTGMNRLGFRPADVADVCKRLSSSPSVAALRLMMHFARAEEDDGLKEPLAVFEAACRAVPVLAEWTDQTQPPCVDRRQQAEDDSGSDREEDSNRDSRDVQRHVVKPWEVGGKP